MLANSFVDFRRIFLDPSEDRRMVYFEATLRHHLFDIEIMRGRFNKSFERPQPLEPDKVHEYSIDLRGNDYVFRKGYRMMVQVQSSWFPLYDRNPEQYVDNIFLAQESDFQNATQRIYLQIAW